MWDCFPIILQERNLVEWERASTNHSTQVVCHFLPTHTNTKRSFLFESSFFLSFFIYFFFLLSFFLYLFISSFFYVLFSFFLSFWAPPPFFSSEIVLLNLSHPRRIKIKAKRIQQVLSLTQSPGSIHEKENHKNLKRERTHSTLNI